MNETQNRYYIILKEFFQKKGRKTRSYDNIAHCIVTFLGVIPTKDVIYGHEDVIYCLCISKDDSWFASSSGYLDKSIKIWDTESCMLLKTLSGRQNNIYCCDFSPDSKLICSGSMDHTLQVWDIENEECVADCIGHTRSVMCCAWAHNGEFILSGAWDMYIKMWDPKTGECLHSFMAHERSTTCISIYHNHNLFVSGGWDNCVRIWNFKKRECQTTLRKHTQVVQKVAISKNDQYIVSCGNDRGICVWDAFLGILLNFFESSRMVMSCTITFDNELIMTGDSDGILRIWCRSTGKLKKSLAGHDKGIRCLALSNSNAFLISGSYDRQLRLWKLNL